MQPERRRESELQRDGQARDHAADHQDEEGRRAVALELAFSPPFWLHILLWLPLTSAAVVLSLRVTKGLMLALEYRHKAAEGRIASDE